MSKSIPFFFLLLFVGFSNVKAQSKFTTGDKELDNSIAVVTKYSRSNMAAFQDAIIGKYNITNEQAQTYTAKLSGGDLLMVFEIASALNKTKEEITQFYTANRIKKDWAEIIKELGIKDKTFETIKSKVVNNGIV
jgi:hypothetical protein